MICASASGLMSRLDRLAVALVELGEGLFGDRLDDATVLQGVVDLRGG